MSGEEESKSPSFFLCGLTPDPPPSTQFSGDGETCPKCKQKTVRWGYGLFGGGMGPWEVCDSGGVCDWFAKKQDAS
jgi:hypothetical protein